MARLLPVVCLVCLLSVVNVAQGDLKISAFNIQKFGRAKVANEEAFRVIVEIVRQYDIILIQEIVDNTEAAIYELLGEVNKGGEAYGISLSKRLGRTSSKEQYAYLYREKSISIVEEYQYPENENKFERPPYCVRVQVNGAEIGEFVLIGIHTSPRAAFAEINALKVVHDAVRDMWKIDDIMMMGDFNAGCSYVSKKKLQELDLRTPDFHWLITDDADTTLGTMQCPYDRFVLSGNRFLEAVVPGSADVLQFDTKYCLTHAQAEKVSDHYPIEFSLRTSSSSGLAAFQQSSFCEVEATNSGASIKASSFLFQVVKQMRSMLEF